ncbi:uncharacterized protein NEMAJ01_0143 [Nematocida major]|uniref:uncharacterized protein n=1 Tax=Nematocida major TaxID=1912982 RepID=UPI0020080083|nr:uncharacterized protein NEMAJ01_0143 [Nematocida major]KAH9385247.1 hypothetical protein NEMAJ01_0143 [Nematocida major]
MEKRELNTELLRKTVRELLSIMENADVLPKETFHIQKFFLEQRSKIIQLGKLVVVLSGIPENSKEALKFGRLLVSNYICSNVVSIEFLNRALTCELESEGLLKEEIIQFVSKSLAYLKKDKKDFLRTIKKEKSVLKRLKTSEKAARSNPEWKSEIETLEERIRNISLIIRNRAAPKKETAKPPKDRGFRDLIYRLSRLKCFCSFKRKAKVSKYDVLREVTLHMLETQSICYISIIPFMCKDRQKINIEMCSPLGIEPGFIGKAKKYIKYTLQELAKSCPRDAARHVRACVAEYRKTGDFEKTKLRDALMALSPSRTSTIEKVVESPTNRIFHINIIRILYLLIHDSAFNKIQQYKKLHSVGTNTLAIFVRENRIYHRALIRRYASTPKDAPLERVSEDGGQSLHFLVRSKAFADTFYLTRTISDGIFTADGILSSYYRTYHVLRTSILASLLDILTKKVSAIVCANIDSRARRDRKCSADKLHSIVKRRILSLLHVMTIRFLKTKNISPREFVSSINLDEFEKRGIPGCHKEVWMFLLLALPMFVFSASILRV